MPESSHSKTLLIILTALTLAVLCILPSTRNLSPLWIVTSAATIADTLFHELGHSITGWLLGVANVPAILTLFGRDQAGGFTMQFGHFWMIQAIALLALCYFTYDRWKNESRWCYVLAMLTLLITAIAISGYYKFAIAYMGHGGAMMMGTFFLYRAWLGLAARNGFERWLNAFFGLFLILNNVHFAYMLAFDSDFNAEYSDHVIGGVSHHDFVQMAELVHGLTVQAIAKFTVGFGMVLTVGACLAALMAGREEKEEGF